MQEELAQKPIAIAIRATELTASTLQKALKMFLEARKNHKNKLHTGEQSLKRLKKHGASLSNMEITEQNIGEFKKVAKKYEMDFALRKDNTEQPPRFIVIFKGKDKENMEQAFKEFVALKLDREKKPSVRKQLSEMRDKAKELNRTREKVKVKDRGPEL